MLAKELGCIQVNLMNCESKKEAIQNLLLSLFLKNAILVNGAIYMDPNASSSNIISRTCPKNLSS